MTKPKTLDQLQAEKEQAETQLAQEQHKLERLENRKKYLEKGERTKRTHRLCNLGGTVESLAPEVKDLTRTEMTGDWLYQQFSGDNNEAQTTEAPAKKEPKPELKLEDVRAVLAEKSRAGHTAEVRALLKKYGAAKLSEIDPANYEALMKDAEVIGNGS